MDYDYFLDNNKIMKGLKRNSLLWNLGAGKSRFLIIFLDKVYQFSTSIIKPLM